MNEEQAAKKIEKMMQEDPELAKSIAEGVAVKAVNAIEGWLEKNGYMDSNECPAGLGPIQVVILKDKEE